MRFVLENVTFTDLKHPSTPKGCAEEPLTVVLNNVVAQFRDGAQGEGLFNIKDGAFVKVLTSER